MSASTPLLGDKKSKPKSNLAASLSNFSIQYNLAAASVAIQMMTSVYRSGKQTNNTDVFGPELDDDFTSPGKNNTHHALYKEPEWSKMVILGLVFAGAVVGMTMMGYLGDILGRKRAYCITLGFIIIGSLGAAVFPWGTDNAVFGILSTCRFILGVGVGGLYPLSAVKAAESASAGESKSTRTAWAFFWQTPGALVPYIVAWVLLQFSRQGGPHYAGLAQFEFRMLFGLGSVVPLYLLFSELKTIGNGGGENETQEEARGREAGIKQRRAVMMKDPKYWKQLIGTGGSWFLYDISYYGTAIFQPQIVEAIFQPSAGDDLTDAFFWHNLVIGLMAFPGVIGAVLILKKIGARNLNLYGFWLIALGFAGLAICFQIDEGSNSNHTQPHNGTSGPLETQSNNVGASAVSKWVKFALFCFVNCMLNFGPNIATYVLPAIIYPYEVRSTFHGLSSASAKVGAVVGTFMYTPLQTYGIAVVLWVQVFFAVCGAIVTIFFIEDDRKVKDHEYKGVNSEYAEI